MAKFIPILGQLSGTLSGVVFSHNRNGAYVRARALPINPLTNRQTRVRGVFSFYADNWGLITIAQQTAWRAYAQTMPLIDSLGQTYFMSGFNAFIRGNAMRVLNALSDRQDAPVLGGQAAAITPDPSSIVLADSASALPNTIQLDLVNLNWAGRDQGGTVMQVSLSPILTPGVIFFSTPFQVKGRVFGDVGSPPTFASIASELLLLIGQRLSVRLRWVDINARVSPAYQELVTVTTVP